MGWPGRQPLSPFSHWLPPAGGSAATGFAGRQSFGAACAPPLRGLYNGNSHGPGSAVQPAGPRERREPARAGRRANALRAPWCRNRAPLRPGKTSPCPGAPCPPPAAGDPPGTMLPARCARWLTPHLLLMLVQLPPARCHRTTGPRVSRSHLQPSSELDRKSVV